MKKKELYTCPMDTDSIVIDQTPLEDAEWSWKNK
jgi:hypothetical protein